MFSAGGTASGKTTVCDSICEQLGDRVALLQMDRFYKSLPHDEPAASHNFDEPNAFDWPLFIETLQRLSTGKAVQVPQYSFETHQRLDKLDTFEGADVILVEGILVLHDPLVSRATAHSAVTHSQQMQLRCVARALDVTTCNADAVSLLCVSSRFASSSI